jgi:hypothetical protein
MNLFIPEQTDTYEVTSPEDEAQPRSCRICSLLGFVHEFRALDPAQVQELLEKKWTPAGVTLPDEQLLPEVIASLIRMTGGNLRLLTRLLTQIEAGSQRQ